MTKQEKEILFKLTKEQFEIVKGCSHLCAKMEFARHRGNAYKKLIKELNIWEDYLMYCAGCKETDN